LDTRTVKASDRFEARLAEPLSAANGVTIEAGRKIKGHVSAVEPGLQTRMILSFDEIETGHGWAPLIATVTGVPGEHGLRRIGDEGEIGRKGMSKEEIAEAVVVGAGKGAEEGEKSAGKHGAVTGAGSGAASAAYSAFDSGHDLVLEKGTALEIRLDRNLAIPSH
jgi:cysteine synthase